MLGLKGQLHMDANSAQAVSEIWWFTKVVVPLAGVLIASVIIPLLLHRLKYKREREERLFDARKEAYEEYFKKLESAARDVGQEYERFLEE
jgi:phosphate/sulfate permease